MPYEIRKRGNRFQVVTRASGKVHGDFRSHEQAYGQLKAIMANDGEEAKGPRQATTAQPKPSKYYGTQ